MYTIFYSWQSDLHSKYNRNFIESCLKDSIKKISKQESFNIDLNLDRDTKNESGTPDIAQTIFKKISNAHIFICDISIINYDSYGKKTPNPNVLLELGYAAAILGWENVICVFNTAYADVTELPFDLKIRRPIQYFYNESLFEKPKDLSEELVRAIKNCHPEKIDIKNKITHEFRNETFLSKKIAIDKPDFWEFKLCEELFRYYLDEIKLKQEEIKVGISFRKPIPLENREFIELMSDEINFIIKTVEGLTTLVNKSLLSALGPVGVAGDPIQILRSIRNIFNMIDGVLDWQKKLIRYEIDERFQESKEILIGMVQDLFVDFYKLPLAFKEVYKNPNKEGGHKIQINLQVDEIKKNRFVEIMNFYSENINNLF